MKYLKRVGDVLILTNWFTSFSHEVKVIMIVGVIKEGRVKWYEEKSP